MELINIRNNKRVYVKDEDIVDGIYHFKYKIDFSQTPEKIQKDKEYISKLKYQIALYDIKSDNLYLINRDQVYNKVFNDPSYVEGDIQDPDMKALYDSIYNRVFG